MDSSDKNNSEIENRNEEPSNYNNPPEMAGDWRFHDANFANSSMVGPTSSSGAMVGSFGQPGWEHPVNMPSLGGFSEMNVNNGLFVPNPNMSGMLTQVPADSAFIERAARFSSFSGGQFWELLNPFGIQQPVNPYLHETSKGVSVAGGAITEERCPKNGIMVERSHGEANQGVLMSGNDSEEPESSGGGGAREDGIVSPAKGVGAKKRKKANQDAESEQANDTGKVNSDIQHKGEQSPTPTGNKSNGKHGKQNSDPAKDEYIHVRARRGQATNSHSLAERVRREKISERMKFLQDLVPGCSKVTGKAVMLDEIINYVQSLQRQVEFLSMKLATVNPRLDFNIDQLLPKDHMLSTRPGPSGIGLSPSVPMAAYPTLHPTQPPILPPGLPGIGNFSDMLRRTINSQLTNMVGGEYKESPQHLPNAWDDELHHVVHMGFNASPSLDNQEVNCPAEQGPANADS